MTIIGKSIINPGRKAASSSFDIENPSEAFSKRRQQDESSHSKKQFDDAAGKSV